jgi:hypothetical protein
MYSEANLKTMAVGHFPLSNHWQCEMQQENVHWISL